MYLRDQNAEALRKGVTHGFQQVERGEFEDVSSEAEFLELARKRR